MKVFILAKKDMLEVCKQLEHKIKSTGKDVVIFNNSNEFYTELKEAEQGEMAYTLVDVRTFQSDSFNPYSEVALMKNPVPLVVFNDPYPDPDFRAAFWISKNKTYLAARIGDEAIDSLYPSFCLLQRFLNGEINKYIPVIACHAELLSKEDKRMRLIFEGFKANSKLPPSRLRLFDYFWNNIGEELSENEIIASVFGSCTRITRGRFYTYICNLRKALSRETAAKIEILRIFKEHYMMKVSLPTGSAEN